MKMHRSAPTRTIAVATLLAVFATACGANNANEVTQETSGAVSDATGVQEGGEQQVVERINANFDDTGMPRSDWLTCDETTVGAIAVADIVEGLGVAATDVSYVSDIESSNNLGAFCTVSTTDVDLVLGIRAEGSEFVGLDRAIEITTQVRERNDLDPTEFTRSAVDDRPAVAWLNPIDTPGTFWKYQVLVDMGGFGLEVYLRSYDGDGPTDAQEVAAAELLAQWAGNYE